MKIKPEASQLQKGIKTYNFLGRGPLKRHTRGKPLGVLFTKLVGQKASSSGCRCWTCSTAIPRNRVIQRLHRRGTGEGTRRMECNPPLSPRPRHSQPHLRHLGSRHPSPVHSYPTKSSITQSKESLPLFLSSSLPAAPKPLPLSSHPKISIRFSRPLLFNSLLTLLVNSSASIHPLHSNLPAKQSSPDYLPAAALQTLSLSLFLLLFSSVPSQRRVKQCYTTATTTLLNSLPFPSFLPPAFLPSVPFL